MNPLSMETMFLILSGVILAAGVLYWFWSHIQLTQKKVQLLENAVFELRGMLAPPGPSGGEGLEPAGQTETYKDLEDDDWAEENIDVIGRTSGAEQVETRTVEPRTVEARTVEARTVEVPQAPFVPEPITREEPAHNDFMAELQARDAEVHEVTAKEDQSQTLEGLTVKELRRMASERGITGTSDMKKKDVIAALRGTVETGAELDVDVEQLS
jgi:hypothetical protein